MLNSLVRRLQEKMTNFTQSMGRWIQLSYHNTGNLSRKTSTTNSQERTRGLIVEQYTITLWLTERKPINSVNRTPNSCSMVALCGRVLQLQGTVDRHPVTACNLRQKTRIAIWNVRTMSQPGKLECITREASRLKLDALGLFEVRWKNSGRCTTDEHVMIYSGHKTEHRHGVRVLLSKQVAK